MNNQNTLQIKAEIYKYYQYLFDYFGFKETYWNGNYGYLGKGFCLGIEKEYIRLLFVKEAEIPQVDILIGTQTASFENPDFRGRKFETRAWFRLASIVEFFTFEKIYSQEEYKKMDIFDFQSQLSERIKPLIREVIENFEEKKFKNWIDNYYEFVLRKNS